MMELQYYILYTALTIIGFFALAFLVEILTDVIKQWWRQTHWHRGYDDD